MGLFLHAVGSVTPTESAEDRSLLHCEGVNNQSYYCESGHCCGESQCCSYYYELWWFWLVWAIIFILSCCCVCHHRRTKHRLQQQQRQHEINLIAYREAHNYPSVPFYFRFLPNYLLPDYEEVVNRPPTPPPPYSALHTGPTSVATGLLDPERQDGHCPTTQPTPAPADSESLSSRASLEDSDDKPAQTAHNTSVILASDTLEDGPTQDGLNGQEKQCEEEEEDSSKDPLLKDAGLSDSCTEEKDRLRNGRRRRFTGDSGIEVCVCGIRRSASRSGAGGTGQEGKELRELQSLLCRQEDEAEEDEDDADADFCDSCGYPASFSVEDEQGPGAPERRVLRGSQGAPLPAPQTGSSSLHPPACLHLHTISEHEGPHHSTSTEPQG